MRLRPLASTVGLALIGGLVVGSAGTTPATATGSVSAAPSNRVDVLTAVVRSPVGGDWSVRFVDEAGTVMSSVKHDAIALKTAAGRIPADRVLSVEGDIVELGTSKPALTASVQVSPAGEGGYAVTVTGHGKGITAVSADFNAPKSERYLGMGERSDAVDHRGHQVLNRVQDGPYTPTQAVIVASQVPAVGLGDRPDSTYFPVPWVLSTSGYGVLVDNDEDSSFELATPQHPDVNRLVVKADHLDLRVFGGPTPAQALSRMTAAIGRQPAPTTPALYGAWFQPRGDAAAEIAAQRQSGIPVSVAQTYAHYLPCGAQVTDRERALTQALHDTGVQVTTYFNPMVCTTYSAAYDEGIATGAFTGTSDGSPLVYPYNTASHFLVSQLDFSGAPGRDLFHKLLGESVDDGYDGWMEDFGEYTPQTAVSADGTPGPTMHNRYVEQYHAAARSFEEQAPRPLLRFNRSGWTGAVKESSIVWGGDPTTGWGFDGLTSSVRQGLTMGTSGVSVWGPDIGGFFTLPGDPQGTPELLNRWIEYGAFTGVMRLQSGGIQILNPAPAKVDNPEVAPIWKRYTRLRTMLYPYIAGSQDAYQQSGLPLMRHLALVTPHDNQAVRTNNEYLFGSDLLVAPVTSPGATSRKVYLPKGQWIELARSWNLRDNGSFSLRNAHVVGGKQTVTAKAPQRTIPLFLRAGAVIPMLPKSVDTLSDYGVDSLVHLDDVAGQRILLAAPAAGTTKGTLGPDETLTSTVADDTWTLQVAASQARSYDVRATLSALDAGWTPCTVTVDGRSVPFQYDVDRNVLRFTADLAADGQVLVTACD